MGAGLQDLPSELQALVQFLDLDTRACVILHTPSISKTTPNDALVRDVYLNPRFRQLPVAQAELEDLKRAIRLELENSSALTALHGRFFRDKRWETRVSGDYCVVVVQEGGNVGNEDGFKKSTARQVDAQVAPPFQTTVESGLSPGISLDWTQGPIPDMSAWTQFLRTFNWSSTGVGALSNWSLTLRQCALCAMANPNPRLIVWGHDMTFIYNEACLQLFGERHPGSLGRNASVPWPEVWSNLSPLVETAYQGRAASEQRILLAVNRNNFVEETYWDFTALPVFNEQGFSAGVLIELTERTGLVIGNRRRNSINNLSEKMFRASTLEDLWARTMSTLAAMDIDVPFALFYAIVDDVPDDNESPTSESFWKISKKCVLVDTVGISADHPEAHKTFSLIEHIQTGPGIVKPCLQAWRTHEATLLTAADGSLPASLTQPLVGRAFGDPIRTALISPIKTPAGSEVVGFLVTGLNPRCAFQDEYSLFISLYVSIIEKAAALISLPEEQRRAQKMADEVNNALAQQLRVTTLQAEQSEAKFSRLASTAPTGMFMFDGDGRIVYVNDTYLEMVGFTREELQFRKAEETTLSEEVHEHDRERFVESWREAMEQKIPINIEFRLKRPWISLDKSSGREITGETWLLATAFPQLEADGKVATVQGWLTDISHRKFSENLLSQRLDDALENKRQSENFIDMTSHEMRNPLSAILQSADSIVSTLDAANLSEERDGNSGFPFDLADEIIDAVQTIILCAQHQKRIVDDILTLSKLDASLLIISPDRVQPPVLVEKALKMYEAEIARAGIDAQLCIEESYSELNVEWLLLDPSRLLQVIINLLTNAIKFTQYADTREIRVYLGASHQLPTGRHHHVNYIPLEQANKQHHDPTTDWGTGNSLYLQIAVIDTGRGLSDEEMKVLFQRFQQASPKTYNKYGGSGLGLFISRKLCELQGGQIGVASSNGLTTFSFFVKAKHWDPSAGDQQLSEPLRTRFASASASPMAFTRRGSIVMKELVNGTEKTITPLSTRSSSPGDRQSFLMNAATSSSAPSSPLSQNPPSLPKPRLRHASTSPMERLIEEPASSALSRPPSRALHILIVEDNLINQKVLSQQLRRAGCTVHLANHGVECLNFLQRSTFWSAPSPSSPLLTSSSTSLSPSPLSLSLTSSTSTSPPLPTIAPLDAILLDLEMPTMDGLTTIRHIRAWQAAGTLGAHVPVIAVTANARSEQIHRAIEAGMDQVVTKPFRIPELIPQLEALVSEVTGAGLSARDGRVEEGRGGRRGGV